MAFLFGASRMQYIISASGLYSTLACRNLIKIKGGMTVCYLFILGQVFSDYSSPESSWVTPVSPLSFLSALPLGTCSPLSCPP
jgi:hypothetical protein